MGRLARGPLDNDGRLAVFATGYGRECCVDPLRPPTKSGGFDLGRIREASHVRTLVDIVATSTVCSSVGFGVYGRSPGGLGNPSTVRRTRRVIVSAAPARLLEALDTSRKNSNDSQGRDLR